MKKIKEEGTGPGEETPPEKSHVDVLKELAAELVPQVRERLGPERLAKLAETPGAHAAGGIDEVLREACMQTAGFPQPVISGAIRTLQLCGCVANEEDLKGLNS